MKIKKLARHEQFWNKFIEFCMQTSPDAIILLSYELVLSDEFVLNHTNRAYLKKRLGDRTDIVEKYKSLNPTGDRAELELALVDYLIEQFVLYIRMGKWHDEKMLLPWVYEKLMSAYKRADYSFDEIVELLKPEAPRSEAGNWAMTPFSWLLIKSIIEDDIDLFTRVFSKIAIIQQQAQKYYDLSSLVIAMRSDSNIRKLVTEFVASHFSSDEELFKQYESQLLDDGRIAVPRDIFELMVYSTETGVSEHRELVFYQGYIKSLHDRIIRLTETYTRIIEKLREEVYILKERIATYQGSNEKVKVVYVDNREKYEGIISDLQIQLAEKDEELAFLRSQIGKVNIEQADELDIEPFNEPVYVNYFGLRNDALEIKLYRYNVFLKYYDATNPNQPLPETGPVVFNISVASHAVFEKIRYLKPLIVTGSNADILAKRILEWLKQLIKKDG